MSLLRPELLSPAGTLAHLRMAYAYGADAIYAGMPRYGLRVRENDFNLQNLQTGITEAHQQGKKLYVTANIFAHNRKVHTFLDDLAPVIALQPDALIMADPGLIHLVREQWPEQEIHLSVQANTVNFAAVKFWQSIGIRRIILSRELSLEEIEEIRQACPDIELEVFVHGALCMAYSGRCLLSGYINHRDANQGTCTNACRWGYKEVASSKHDNGDLQPVKLEKTENFIDSANPKDCTDSENTQRILIEEIGRPGEPIAVEEDEHGTYIMNSKDLRALEHIHRLVEIGVNSLKIEGRTKSLYYVARVTQLYRRVIDDATAGRPFDPHLLAEAENLASRGYTDGFFQRHHSHEYQNYLQGNSQGHRQLYVAEMIATDPEKPDWIHLRSKNKFAVGDRVEIILPSGNRELVLSAIENTKNGQPMDEVPGGGFEIRIPLEVDDVDLPFGMITRFI